MSTYHTLLKRPDGVLPAFEGDTCPNVSPAIEIGLDERSSKFDLHVFSQHLRLGMRDDDADQGSTMEVASGLTFADLRVLRDKINYVLDCYDELETGKTAAQRDYALTTCTCVAGRGVNRACPVHA